MHAIKAVGLGTVFAAVLFVAFVVGLSAQNGLRRTGHAALGLGAVIGAVKASTVYNPYFWLVVVLAYGAAFWLTPKELVILEDLSRLPHSAC